MLTLYSSKEWLNPIKYSPLYKTGATKYFVVHHSGPVGSNPLSPSQHLEADNINNAHYDRWRFPSKFISGSYGGYNFFIDRNGKVTQFRAIGEETAANKSFNFNGVALSVCLAGNFTSGVEKPTEAQISSLRALYEKLPKVSPQNIVPHRGLQQTACYGSGLKDSWAREILTKQEDQKPDPRIAILKQLVELYIRLLELKRKLGRKLSGELKDDNRIDLRG